MQALAVRIYIHRALCTRCRLCARSCPGDAITVGLTARIQADKCTGCEACVEVCPQGAIAYVHEHANQPLGEVAEA